MCEQQSPFLIGHSNRSIISDHRNADRTGSRYLAVLALIISFRFISFILFIYVYTRINILYYFFLLSFHAGQECSRTWLLESPLDGVCFPSFGCLWFFNPPLDAVIIDHIFETAVAVATRAPISCDVTARSWPWPPSPYRGYTADNSSF